MITMHLQQIVCILIILTISVLASTGLTVISVSGFQFAYQPSTQDNFNLDSASNGVSPSWTSNRLWLTPDPATTQSSLLSNAAGRVTYTYPLPLFNPATGQVLSFNTSFTFSIITASSYGDAGDGLAFSISPFLNMPNYSGGGALGIAVVPNVSNYSSSPDRHLFAVEFDTYQNLAFLDPSSSHVGIDFNGLTSNATFDSNDLQSDLYLYNNYTIFAWVEYIAPLHLTRVFAANSSERPAQPCVNATHDLSDLFDPNQLIYAAISATSGSSVQGTSLFNWSFAISDLDVPSPAPSPEIGLSPLSLQPPLTSHPGFVPPPSTSRPGFVLPLTLSLLGVLLLVAACGLIALCRKRKEQSLFMIELIHSSTGSVPRFSFWDLKKATHGFCNAQKVGEGGFSSVYKGTLPTGDVVAVKRLKEGLRMEEEFASEIQIISRIRHRNLLQLRGWGYEAGEALLVYQYMPNGSLDSYLFGKKRGQKGLLDGGKRFSILVGVAAGLEYLHEGLGECVLHRDVKAANVMLTESFEAMLGDFGLARLITHDQAVTMTAAGTPGYVAPEVVYTGRATDRADVYSFGILALEVASGRRALDETRPPEEMRLLDWAWQLQQNGSLMDALDPVCCPSVPVNLEQKLTISEAGTIAGCTEANAVNMIAEVPLLIQARASDDKEHMASDGYSSQEHKWQCVLHLALLCCNPFPEDRPTMRHVHQALRESVVLPLPSVRPTYIRPGAAFTAPSFESLISSSAPSSTLDPSSSLSTAPSSLFSQ